jgi:hypothetical protein
MDFGGFRLRSTMIPGVGQHKMRRLFCFAFKIVARSPEKPLNPQKNARLYAVCTPADRQPLL